jgi:hypothetical protein
MKRSEDRAALMLVGRRDVYDTLLQRLDDAPA